MDPITWYAWEHENTDVQTIRFGATLLTAKDQVYDLQQDLEANSLDYYAATRSVWLQRRSVDINDAHESGQDLDYDEY